MDHPPYAFYYLDGDGESHTDHPAPAGTVSTIPEDFIPLPALGFLHPDQYLSSNWTWASAVSFQEAVVNALNSFLRVTDRRCLTEQAWQHISDDNSRKNPLLAGPAPAYHPQQRSNEDGPARANRFEVKIATDLLAVGIV